MVNNPLSIETFRCSNRAFCVALGFNNFIGSEKSFRHRKSNFWLRSLSSVSTLSTVTGQTLGIPLEVFGPETHMTAIVGMALDKNQPSGRVKASADHPHTTANFLLPDGQESTVSVCQ